VDPDNGVSRCGRRLGLLNPDLYGQPILYLPSGKGLQIESPSSTSRSCLYTAQVPRTPSKPRAKRPTAAAKVERAPLVPVEPAITRHSSLAHALKTDIATGQFAVGTKLPTEFELCQRFNVSRSTVRQALAELEAAGLVRRRQGSGTTVVAREPPVRYSLSLASEADILRFVSETVLDLTEFARPVTSADSRRLRLGAPAEWRVWRGMRRATSGGPPLGIASVYVPIVYLEAMKTLEKQPQRAIFEHISVVHGLVVTAIEQEISATVVDADEGKVLQAPTGTPALSITRRFVSGPGLIEVSETVYPADRFSYEIRLERAQTARMPR
jgi:GntR family transcriptional regulator